MRLDDCLQGTENVFHFYPTGRSSNIFVAEHELRDLILYLRRIMTLVDAGIYELTPTECLLKDEG